MTTPESPDRPGLSPKPDTVALTDTINELDNLITDKASVPQEKTGNTGIPVLDEMINPEDSDYMDDLEMLLHQEKPVEPPPPQEHLSQEQLEHIISNVEEKLAGELDALVNILKDSIKDSIMSEIKTQLESSLHKTGSGKPDDDHS